jgi:signal transduction histidine kinase
MDERREMARGIHPAILAEGGIVPALRTLARRSPVPVELDLQLDGRLPEPVEVAAYYVVSESLTNVAKHAGASLIQVTADDADGYIRITVTDDGAGGPAPPPRAGRLLRPAAI